MTDKNLLTEKRQELEKAGDTQDLCRMRFYHTIRRLIKTAVDNNDILKINKDVLNMIRTYVEGMKEEDFDEIANDLIFKAYPYLNDIKNREVDKFVKYAVEIFNGIPETFINAVADAFKNSSSDEGKSDFVNTVYDIIHSLVRMSMKKNILRFEKLDSEKVNILTESMTSFGLVKTTL